MPSHKHAAAALCLLVIGVAQPATAQTDIAEVPLDSLLNVPVDAASRYRQSARNAPASVTVISSADFERFGYETLSEVFASVRGLYIGDDRNYTTVGVRGFSRPSTYENRVAMLRNGQRINESVYGSAPSGPDLGLSLEAVDRVEIVRGPGASLFGTGAMMAVVNIVTRDGGDIDGLLGQVEVGSHGKKTAAVTYGGLVAGGVDLIVTANRWDVDGEDLYFAEFDDPATHGGIADGLDWQEATGAMALAGRGGLRLQGWFVSRRKGVPTASYGTAFNDDRLQTLDEFGSLGPCSSTPSTPAGPSSCAVT
jgi:iron complex outermembrane receptor protein